ncbi:hypothetical protein EDB87DRAFT_549859 [Lactarius vividus]|nr:hypothetical protein EDB87DRAFT_549859 [Lactarius vividus]
MTRKKQAEAEQRRKEGHDLVGRKQSTGASQEKKVEEHIDVGDTDGLDPLGDFDAWQLRELARIKREEEAEIAREQEGDEIERRRALPEEQRMKEDLAHAQRSRDEKLKGAERRANVSSKILAQGCLPSGPRNTQASRLHRSHRIDCRCLLPTVMQAKELREA